MDVIFGNLDLWGTAIKNTLLVFFGGGALAPVVFGGVGDALGVSVAVMVLAGVLLVTLPLAWVVQRGVEMPG